MNLSASSAAIGEIIQVTVAGWPSDLLTVTICGNSAKRGSPDCNLNATVAVSAVQGAVTTVGLTIAAPPVPCPCVVRAATRLNDLVRTEPLDIPGIPVEGLPDPPEPLTVDVSFAPAPGKNGFFDEVRRLLAGPQHRVLSISLHNNTSGAMQTLSLQIYLGDPQGGESVAAPTVQPLQPGEQRTYQVPIDISAPSWGTKDVRGTVYGLPNPISFHASETSTPWLLYVFGAALGVDVVAWRVLRRRARKRRVVGETLPDGEHEQSARETVGEQTVQRQIAAFTAR